VPAAALLAGLLAALAPVALRNYAVGGQLALVSSHGGLNFYIGNNARADGTYRMVAGITPSISGQDRDMRKVAEQALGRPVSDVEASSWFYDQAWAWVRDNPAPALALFARKVAYVFNAEDIPLNDSFTYYSRDESLLLRALFVGPWLLLPLGIVGVWLGGKHLAAGSWQPPAHQPAQALPAGSGFSRIRPPAAGEPATMGAWWAWVAFVPVYALAVAIFFVTGRYRLPLLLPLCVTSAGAVLAILANVNPAKAGSHEGEHEGGAAGGPGAAPRWRRLVVPVAMLLVLGAATNWDLGLDNGLAGWRSEMVLYDVQAHRDQEAMELLARTEPIYPNRGLLLYRVGRAYLARGDAAQALGVFQRGLRVDPGRGELQVATGEALLEIGRTAEAIPLLEAARRTPAVEDRATLALARAEVVAGRTGQGLAMLRALRTPDRLDAQAQLAAGQLALENGDAAVAEPFLRRAVSQAPGNSAAQEALGLALAMQGRREEAAPVLEQACRLDPGSASSRLNLAIVYGEMGRVAEARRLAEEALRLRPDYGRARQFLAAISQ
jgi:tetratricopeptide (TPR) repeat protein